ncbi:MAG: hypothetical protein HZA90_20490 [Verrucomicrobia bacterium]|nr:hypothetical protein [Verrucomicrobiota bacterium]
MVDEFFRANPNIEDGKDYVWRSNPDWCCLRARRGEFCSPAVVKRQLRDAVSRIAAKYSLPDVLNGRSSKQFGNESDWVTMGNLRLEGPHLLLVDPGLSGDDQEGLRLDSPAGNYEVLIRVMAFGPDHRVSRLRVVLQGGTPALGQVIEKGAVDTGRFAVCDDRAFRHARSESDAAALKDFFARMSKSCYGVVELSGVAVFHTECGFGDSSYSIFELRQRSKRIGVEVEFIPSL